MFHSLRNILSFCLCVRFRSDDALGRDLFADISRIYANLAPPVCGIASALAGVAGLLLLRLCGIPLLSAAVTLLIFYLLRGIKLIDGFCDLTEGLTYSVYRNKEKAWDVIHSQSNGSFAILWTALMLLVQCGSVVGLQTLSIRETIALFFACGALSAESVVFAHTKKTAYNEGTAFSPFRIFTRIGQQLTGAAVCIVCCIPLLFLGSGELYLRAGACAAICLATFVFSKLSGIYVIRRLGAVNGDLFGCLPLVMYTFLLCVYSICYGAII